MTTQELATPAPQPGQISRAWRKTREMRLPWVPIVVLGLLMVAAIFAPLLAPHDPEQLNKRDREVPPFETSKFLLGTDKSGKDILSRLIYGARTSVFISLVALGTGAVVGSAIGVISGYFGGRTDIVLMRLVDAVLGFPTVLLALIIVAIAGGAGIGNVIIAVAATVWARFARQARGEVLSIKERDFVTLAIVAGVSPPVIMWRHIFPNVINTVLIVISLLVGQTILLEASLSFLGVGVPPGDPAWGIMVSEGRDQIFEIWWLALFPGLAITIVVMAMNFFGDWLRDTLDPRLRRTR
ncbi:MAG: ABC transporter permease [Chloroflexi bacterium]|nr:ABC transporter permease [Chloroflexota bacterium]